MPVTVFFDGDNFMIKSILISCQACCKASIYCCSPWGLCLAGLFLAQMVHFWLYFSTVSLIFGKVYFRWINSIVLSCPGCPNRGLLWYLLITFSWFSSGTGWHSKTLMFWSVTTSCLSRTNVVPFPVSNDRFCVSWVNKSDCWLNASACPSSNSFR